MNMTIETAIIATGGSSGGALRPVSKIAPCLPANLKQEQQSLAHRQAARSNSDQPFFKPAGYSPAYLKRSAHRMSGHSKLLLYTLPLETRSRIDLRV